MVTTKTCYLDVVSMWVNFYSAFHNFSSSCCTPYMCSAHPICAVHTLICAVHRLVSAGTGLLQLLQQTLCLRAWCLGQSHAEDILSLCLHDQTALVLLGQTSSRVFAKTFALVHSIASTILVLPDVNPSPSTASGVFSTSSTGSCSQVEDWFASSVEIFITADLVQICLQLDSSQDLLISLAILQSLASICCHLVSAGAPGLEVL